MKNSMELELQQLPGMMKLVGGFLGLKQIYLLFFWPVLGFLKI
jgi:hypothetical protein